MTELPESIEGCVLAGAFKSIERRTADAQPAGHRRLGESGLSPEELERLGQRFGKVHMKTVVDSDVHM